MSGRPRPVRGRDTFRNLLRKGRQARNGPVTVRFLPADDGNVCVAYSVGRKVGGAVVRNRCRRRLRAIAAEISPELRPGCYLIGVGPAAREFHFEQLKEQVIDTMRKASKTANK